MMRAILLSMGLAMAVGCASTKPHSSWDDADKESPAARFSVSPTSKKTTTKTEKAETTTSAKTGIVVDEKDLATLEKMNKAIEAFVLKNQTASFKSLCKDKRFDCFVDDALYPAGRKKSTRSVPPYASGSKMGLNGEKRVQARYDVYP